MSTYRDLLHGGQVERWALDTLLMWMPAYLLEVADQHETSPLPNIKTYMTVNEFAKWPEDQLPACLIIAPGLAGPPSYKTGEGKIQAPWGLGIAVVVSANNQVNTRELARIYGAAVRGVIMQRQSLGSEHVESTDWMDERYDDIPSEDNRSIAAGQNVFRVTVNNVVTTSGGPLTPEDPGPLGIVDTVIITANQKELTAP